VQLRGDELAEPLVCRVAVLAIMPIQRDVELRQQATFDPASSTRTFTLAVIDIGEIYFLPPLMEVEAGQSTHAYKLSTPPGAPRQPDKR
jgi:hypothetical protein